MRKNKRAITLALVMVMLLGTGVTSVNAASQPNVVYSSMSTSTAAQTKAVKESKRDLDESANRLVALGIVEGKGNGNIAAEDNITRAEVTAIILRARGIQSASYSMTKSFDDVPETAWYAKDIAVAKEMELVFGVGNNKFAPEKNVTNAELVTILTRALNYEKTTNDTVSYPVFHIMKAQEAGILKDFTSDMNAISKREDMFLLIDNSLDSKVLEPNALGMYVPSEFTMMERFLGYREVKAEVVDSGSLIGGLDNNKVKVSGAFGKTDKVETKTISTDNDRLLNLDNLFADVIVTIDEKGNVPYVRPVTPNKMDIDEVTEVVRVDREDAIRFKGSNKDYKFSDDLVVIHNYESVETRNLNNLLKGKKVRYELKDNKVSRIMFEDVKEVAIFKEYKNDTLEMKSGSKINIKKSDDVRVYVNGAPAKLEDLKENDLIYKFGKGKEMIIRASRDKVEGKLNSVGKLDKTAKIDDKEYEVSKDVKMALGKDSKVSTGSLDKLVGEKITAYLNNNGEIAFVVSDKVGSMDSIFVVDKVGRDGYRDRDYTDYISLVDSSGRSKTYDVARRADVRNLHRGDLVTADIYGDVVEDIIKITRNNDLKDHDLVELRDVDSRDIDTRNLKITDGRTTYYVESDDTPVFVVSDRYIDVYDFADFYKYKNKTNMSLIVKDRRDVVAIYINDEDFRFDENKTKATVLDMYVTTGSSGRRVTNMEVELENGRTEKYAVDDVARITSFTNRGFGQKSTSLSYIAKGEIVDILVNKKGEIVEINELDLTKDLDVVNNIITRTSRSTITIGNKEYRVAPRALMVDARKDERYVDIIKDPQDLPKDTIVVFSTDKNDNDIDNLVIIGNRGDNFEDALVYERDYKIAVNSLDVLVTKYKTTTDEVTLAELDASVKIATDKKALVQSEASVTQETINYNALVKEVEVLKAANATNVQIFKTAEAKLKADLDDFTKNAETTVTIEQLKAEVIATDVALANVKDKTTITAEIAEFNKMKADIAELANKSVVNPETPETPGPVVNPETPETPGPVVNPETPDTVEVPEVTPPVVGE